MYCLSDKQIDYILNDIGARGVEMESLQQNLVDHVCCIIEQNLEVNGDFENFYQKTIQTFYKDELWEIEEETLLLLTYKNYYTMKKIMINSGIFSAFTFFAGSIFKIMHWPGSSPLIILAMLASSFIFLPLFDFIFLIAFSFICVIFTPLTLPIFIFLFQVGVSDVGQERRFQQYDYPMLVNYYFKNCRV